MSIGKRHNLAENWGPVMSRPPKEVSTPSLVARLSAISMPHRWGFGYLRFRLSNRSCTHVLPYQSGILAAQESEKLMERSQNFL